MKKKYIPIAQKMHTDELISELQKRVNEMAAYKFYPLELSRLATAIQIEEIAQGKEA